MATVNQIKDDGRGRSRRYEGGKKGLIYCEKRNEGKGGNSGESDGRKT